MMVAKATAQDKGFAARWSSRLTYLSSCFPPALRETALAWQQILSDRGQNTLIAHSDAKKRQPGPEICPPRQILSTCATTTTRARVKSRAQCSPQSIPLPTGLGISGREHISHDYMPRDAPQGRGAGAHFSNCLFLCGRKAHLQEGTWISRGSKMRGGKLLDHGTPDIDCECRRATATSPAEAGVVRETSTARALCKGSFPSAVISRGKTQQQLLEFPLQEIRCAGQ